MGICDSLPVRCPFVCNAFDGNGTEGERVQCVEPRQHSMGICNGTCVTCVTIRCVDTISGAALLGLQGAAALQCGVGIYKGKKIGWLVAGSFCKGNGTACGRLQGTGAHQHRVGNCDVGMVGFDSFRCDCQGGETLPLWTSRSATLYGTMGPIAVQKPDPCMGLARAHETYWPLSWPEVLWGIAYGM